MDELEQKATTALDAAIVKFDEELNSMATLEEKMAFIEHQIAILNYELKMNFSGSDKDQLELEKMHILGKKDMMSRFMEGYYNEEGNVTMHYTSGHP